MKVYLDDERETPDGWVRVYWPDEAIDFLKTEKVSEISLDHDLGDDKRGTGYDVVMWIEEAVFTKGFKPPIIKVHSANSSARHKMELGINHINKFTVKDAFDFPICDELVAICTDICKLGYSESEWCERESSDMFQSESFCGGFDSDEKEFCFSYFDKNRKEYWFQFPIETAILIKDKKLKSIQLKNTNA